MQEVCSDVRIEPELMPLDNNLMRNGNNAENARLDVSGIGVWGPFERTFLDIRIMHPNAPSYVDKSIDQVYIAHEKENKRAYSERVIQMEKGTFTPIGGGWIGLRIGGFGKYFSPDCGFRAKF